MLAIIVNNFRGVAQYNSSAAKKNGKFNLLSKIVRIKQKRSSKLLASPHKIVKQKRPKASLRGRWINSRNPTKHNISSPICNADSKLNWQRDKDKSHLRHRSSAPTAQALDLFSSLKVGNIEQLVGKGIMTNTTSKGLETMPFPLDHVQSDRLKQEHNVSITNTPDGISYYRGNSVTSAEVIPGSPLGQYYHSSPLPEDINILELCNGSQGTFGFSIDLNDVKGNEPILIHGKALSGCSMAFARKGSRFFAFHTGQRENEKHKWMTATQGAASLKRSAEKLLQLPESSKCETNQELAIWMSKQFDQSSLIYSGNGDSIVDGHNMWCFDYNSKVSSEAPRVGNAVALLTKNGNEWNIDVLGDDMKIDRTTYETTSLKHQTFKFPCIEQQLVDN
ncbi:cytotoxic necrotizing factor Rho-activating domain-containing protein [Vibrio parahaemolyticus]